MDCCPPGSSVHGILQARILEWVAIPLSRGSSQPRDQTQVYCIQLSSVQSFSRAQLFATPWTAACQASLSFAISQSLLKLMSIKSVMPSNHLILCHPLLLQPSIFPHIRVFSNESVLRIRWPSIGVSASASVLPMISFRIDWFDLLAVQGTLKSLLQHHCSKASILRHSAFFIVQLSQPYMTFWKNHSFD